jgi:hypothetical protein
MPEMKEVASRALADDESFALYQLAHEALANAVHHSRCRPDDRRGQRPAGCARLGEDAGAVTEGDGIQQDAAAGVEHADGVLPDVLHKDVPGALINGQRAGALPDGGTAHQCSGARVEHADAIAPEVIVSLNAPAALVHGKEGESRAQARRA